jgi:glutaredoxin-related protein
VAWNPSASWLKKGAPHLPNDGFSRSFVDIVSNKGTAVLRVGNRWYHPCRSNITVHYAKRYS